MAKSIFKTLSDLPKRNLLYIANILINNQIYIQNLTSLVEKDLLHINLYWKFSLYYYKICKITVIGLIQYYY